MIMRLLVLVLCYLAARPSGAFLVGPPLRLQAGSARIRAASTVGRNPWSAYTPMVFMSGSEEAAPDQAKELMEAAAKLREEAEAMQADLPARPPPAAEPEPEPQEETDEFATRELSDTMKNKLRQELISQGADPNRSAGNPILIISAVVALLVILGGKGIFF